jgi:hypothetical protein
LGKGISAYFGLEESNFEPEDALNLLYKLVYSDFKFFNVFTIIPEGKKMRTLRGSNEKVLMHLWSSSQAVIQLNLNSDTVSGSQV